MIKYMLRCVLTKKYVQNINKLSYKRQFPRRRCDQFAKISKSFANKTE